MAKGRKLVLMVLIISPSAFFLGRFGTRGLPDFVGTAGDPTPTSSFHPQPLLTETDAFLRSLEEFPSEHRFAMGDSTVRLVSMSTLDNEWFESPSQWKPNVPVWVVGFRTVGLTEADVSIDPPFAIFATQDASGTPSPPVSGVYYVWEAEGGLPVAQGQLDDPAGSEAWFTYDRLASLVNEPLVILTATPIPLP